MPPQIENKIEQENVIVEQKLARSHVFLIILMTLLIATGVFGVWYFSHPLPEEVREVAITNEFTGWKTYNSVEYGFSLQYPQGLEVVESKQTDSVSFWDPKNINTLVPPVIRVKISQLDSKYEKIPTGTEQEMLLEVAKNELGKNFNKVKRYNGNEIIVESTDIQGIHSFFYDSQNYIVADILGRDYIDTKKDFYDQILSTFKFSATSTPVSSLKKICPDEWIQNNMPSFGEKIENRQYYILNGERMELVEFDNLWVEKNCKLEKQIVY